MRYSIAILLSILLAALLLGACSRSAPTATTEPSPTAPPTATERPRPTDTSVPTVTETEATATATESAPVATATTASPTATEAPVPTAGLTFLDVGSDDWVHGPDDAAVTLIEYSDFQ